MLGPMLKHFILSLYLQNYPNYNHSPTEEDESWCNFQLKKFTNTIACRWQSWEPYFLNGHLYFPLEYKLHESRDFIYLFIFPCFDHCCVLEPRIVPGKDLQLST